MAALQLCQHSAPPENFMDVAFISRGILRNPSGMGSGWGTHLFPTYKGSSCIPFPTAAVLGHILASPGTWLVVVGTLLAQQNCSYPDWKIPGQKLPHVSQTGSLWH